MDDVRLEFFQDFIELEIGRDIDNRVDLPPEFVDDNRFVVGGFGLFEQGAFRANRRAGNQCNIMSALGQQLTRNQRVFLCTAENQTSYNMNDFHCFINRGLRGFTQIFLQNIFFMCFMNFMVKALFLFIVDFH